MGETGSAAAASFQFNGEKERRGGGEMFFFQFGRKTLPKNFLPSTLPSSFPQIEKCPDVKTRQAH